MENPGAWGQSSMDLITEFGNSLLYLRCDKCNSCRRGIRKTDLNGRLIRGWLGSYSGHKNKNQCSEKRMNDAFFIIRN